jgi:hypothetical protein
MRSNESQKQGRAQPFSMPNASINPTRDDNSNNDFIPHPAQFPLRYRRRSLMPWLSRGSSSTAGDIGLSFLSEKYIPAGTTLDLEIPLRGRVQRFTAKVILVRECWQGYEIGLWFCSAGDAERARIVERICHTECYLKDPSRHHS